MANPTPTPIHDPNFDPEPPGFNIGATRNSKRERSLRDAGESPSGATWWRVAYVTWWHAGKVRLRQGSEIVLD